MIGKISFQKKTEKYLKMEMFIWTTLNGKVSYYKSKMKFEVKNLLQGEEDH